MTAARLLEIYEHLDRMHAWRGWHWWPDGEPFEVIVGAILVQNTSWTNVERALDRLHQAGVMSPSAMDALSDEALEELVRPSGQYRAKARKLRAFLATARDCGGLDALLAMDADSLRRRLLETWGIGPETADAIVLYAAKQPAFVIDAYTQRMMSRLGLGPGGTDYDEWQRWFTERLEAERDLWARYHALIVLHCKHLCRKRSPRCGECSLEEDCAFAQREQGAGRRGE
jgi:endonuclease-3 related protein